jgi:hypothetical protein
VAHTGDKKNIDRFLVRKEGGHLENLSTIGKII